MNQRHLPKITQLMRPRIQTQVLKSPHLCSHSGSCVSSQRTRTVAGPWVSPRRLVHGLQAKARLAGQVVTPKPQESLTRLKQGQFPVLLPHYTWVSWTQSCIPGTPNQPAPTLQKGTLSPRLRGAREQTASHVTCGASWCGPNSSKRTAGVQMGEAWASQGDPPTSKPHPPH